jgi:hypothetical protein
VTLSFSLPMPNTGAVAGWRAGIGLSCCLLGFTSMFKSFLASYKLDAGSAIPGCRVIYATWECWSGEQWPDGTLRQQ